MNDLGSMLGSLLGSISPILLGGLGLALVWWSEKRRRGAANAQSVLPTNAQEASVAPLRGDRSKTRIPVLVATLGLTGIVVFALIASGSAGAAQGAVVILVVALILLYVGALLFAKAPAAAAAPAALPGPRKPLPRYFWPALIGSSVLLLLLATSRNPPALLAAIFTGAMQWALGIGLLVVGVYVFFIITGAIGAAAVDRHKAEEARRRQRGGS